MKAAHMNRFALAPFFILSLACLGFSEQNQDSANASIEATPHKAPRAAPQRLKNSAYVNFYFYRTLGKNDYEYRQYIETGIKHDFYLCPWLYVQPGTELRSFSLLFTLGAGCDFRYFRLGVTGIGGILLFHRDDVIFDKYNGSPPFPIDDRALFDWMISTRIGTNKWNFSAALTPSILDETARNKLVLIDFSLNLNIISIGAYAGAVSVVYGNPSGSEGHDYDFSGDWGGAMYLAINNLLHYKSIKIAPQLSWTPFEPFDDFRFTLLFEW
jgi:hypothetical protein